MGQTKEQTDLSILKNGKLKAPNKKFLELCIFYAENYNRFKKNKTDSSRSIVYACLVLAKRLFNKNIYYYIRDNKVLFSLPKFDGLFNIIINEKIN